MDNQTSISKNQESHLKQKASSKRKTTVIIWLILIIMAASYFLPIPYYQKEDFDCEPDGIHCIRKGWHQGQTLFDTLYDKLFLPKVPESSMIQDQADPTANWKTFRNDEAGYSVMYPDFLDQGVGSSDVPKVDSWIEKNDSYAIHIYTYPDSASFEKGTHLEFNAKVKDEEEIIVSRQATKKLTGIEIDFERGTLIHVGPINYLGKFYLFVYTSGSKLAKEEDLRVFDQILSTFQFSN